MTGRSPSTPRNPSGRTVAKHGLSGPEIDRHSAALHFMELYCRRDRRSRLWWVSVPKGLDRKFIATIQKRITKLQGLFGLWKYSAWVFETRGGLHAHISFVGDADGEIADALRRSEIFGDLIKVAPVTNPTGLVRRYLAKERTPQAGFRRQHMLGGRVRGAHYLAGGGDRVRLSRELERDGIQAGYIEPWQHTNAKRQPQRKPYRPRRLLRTAPRLAGQIPLLPEIEQLPSRLHQFGGGKIPPAVALEIDHRRNSHGLSQRDLAAKIGISQGQYANACRGHDSLSGFAVRVINRRIERTSNFQIFRAPKDIA